MNSYVVLLRGINVGGQNKVSMADLKLYLEKLDYKNVRSFLNSGNILLESEQSPKQITEKIEELLPKKFKLDSSLIKVLVLSHSDLKAVVQEAPKGFGEQPTKYHSDAIFLMGIKPNEAMKVFSPKDGVDTVWPGTIAIYSQRLSAQRVKSRLNRIVGTPAYKNMTIRSWNTTTKLLSLLDEMKAV